MVSMILEQPGVRGKRYMNLIENIPVISTAQMIKVDRLMIEKYQISLIQMMENAGRNLAELSKRMLGGDVERKQIVVLCGAGHNGGGGFVAARHLHNWRADIKVVMAFELANLKQIPLQKWQILQSMGIYMGEPSDLGEADLIIDALIGYGLHGDPRPLIASWIDRANSAGLPILALDVPSGLDATSGYPGKPCIHAAATLTLALPKSGLITSQAEDYVGELFLADISVPPELYAHLGLDVPNLFNTSSILKLI